MRQSCVLVQFRGWSVLFDCVVHSGKNDWYLLPLLEDIWDVKLDCVLTMHFHSDRCTALPYLITRMDPDEVAANMDTLQVHDKGHFIMQDDARKTLVWRLLCGAGSTS